jgi:hypothetical protein
MSDKNLELAGTLSGISRNGRNPHIVIVNAVDAFTAAGRHAEANRLADAWWLLDATSRTSQAAKLLIASAAFSLIAPGGDEDGADPQIAVGRKE